MNGTGESAKRSLAQVGLAGLAGAFLAPLAVSFGVIAMFGGGSAVLVLAPVLFVVVLMAVARVAPEASWLPASRGGRFVWAALVGGVGFGLWLLAWDITDEARLRVSQSQPLWLLLGAVPFALVAGVLLRRWYLSLGSLVVFVAGSLVLLHALAGAVPSDVDQRLAAAQLDRASLMVTTVPGYEPMPQQRTWHLSSRSGSSYIAVGPPLGTTPGQCTYGALTCETESPALRYEVFDDTQQYIRVIGAQEIRISASSTVDRDTLRTAAQSTRPATDDEIRLMLPLPRPTRDRSVMASVRELAVELFGR
ncbi:hypothetical protein [Actinokineospora terrae]|uniref:Uncharacterized protein n=1 Tax=Actinokineospora terrae TaxID=155974 RepID=A0A1H9XGM5_9PSEU|nr:hypothetical protein [Actinokineospora terrae]SES45264.1 hypothetical protein SAMN04487818_11551 [Actinokineospora terrae]